MRKVLRYRSQEEKEFFDLLHSAFSHKRKYMLSNIKSMSANVQKKVKDVLLKNNLSRFHENRSHPVPISDAKNLLP